MKVLEEKFGIVLKTDGEKFVVAYNLFGTPWENRQQRILESQYLLASLIKYCQGETR